MKSERQIEFERSNRSFFARGRILAVSFALLMGLVGLLSVVPPVSFEAIARLTVLRKTSDSPSVESKIPSGTVYSAWGGQLVAEGNSIEFITRLVETKSLHRDADLSPDSEGATVQETARYLRQATLLEARPEEGMVEISVVLENTQPTKVKWWANTMASALVSWGEEMQRIEGKKQREMALRIRERFSDGIKQYIALLDQVGVHLDAGMSMDRHVLNAFRVKEEGEANIESISRTIEQRRLDLRSIEVLGETPTIEALSRLGRRSELAKVPAAKDFLKARDDLLVHISHSKPDDSEGHSASTPGIESFRRRLLTSIESSKRLFQVEIRGLEERLSVLQLEQKALDDRYQELVDARDSIGSLSTIDKLNLRMVDSTAQTLRDIDPAGKQLRESIVFSQRAEEVTPLKQLWSARLLNLGLFGILLGGGLLWLTPLGRRMELESH